MSAIASQLTMKYGFPVTHHDNDTEKAVTIRPASTAVFVVDSADRYNSVAASRTDVTSPYQFSITRNQALLNGFFTRLALTEITFPYYLPNLNSRTTQIEVSHTAIGTAVINLNSGFHTPSEIAAALESALIAAGAPTATVQYIDGRFVVGAGAGNTIAFAPVDNLPLYRFNDFQLFDLLGFTVANGNPSLSQTGRVTRCRYTEYIDIVCSQLTYNQDLKDTSTEPVNRDLLARIYLECENDQPIGVRSLLTPGSTTDAQDTVPGCYPFTIYRQFKSPKQILWNKAQPLGNLTFEVYDDKGNLFTGGNSGLYPSTAYPDWRMTLLVTEN